MVKEAGDLVLVGREGELATILGALGDEIEGRPGLILVAGEAGVGKSRLAREVVGRASAQGWHTMSGKCVHERLIPYMPFSEAFRGAGLEHLMEFSRPPRIEHVLFIYRDGRLCARASRTEGGMDSEVFAGMLTAVGAFVEDSLAGLMESGRGGGGRFNVIGYDQYRILSERRPYGDLVLVITGQETELLRDEMSEVIDRIGRYHGAVLQQWDGDSMKMDPVRSDLELFIESGKYDGVDEVTEPENRHWRLLANVTRGLARASREAPVLILLDNLQWADPSSLGLIRHLLKRLRGERFMVLGTYRPEENTADRPLLSLMNELEVEGLLREVPLGPLAPVDVKRMVGQEIGEGLGEGELGQLIARQSDGNPSLARELVALLMEERVVVREGADWRLTKKVDRIGVPRKVGEAIQVRLEALSRDEREVLETGAVMGEAFRPRFLACMLDMNPLQVHRVLREIEKRCRLIGTREGGKSYRFDSPQVKDVVYGTVPLEMREEYHRAAVDCLAREGGSGIPYLTEMAYHASEGNHPDAVTHLRAAGDAARAEFHNPEAVRLYETALKFAKGGDRAGLLEALGETEFSAGRFNEARAWLVKAREAMPDIDRRVVLVTRLARVLERQGMFGEALVMLSLDAPDERTSPMARARWNATRAWVLGRNRLDLDLAEKDAKDALQAFKDNGGGADDIADCWNTLGVIENGRGRMKEAISYLEQGLAIAEAGGARYQQARVLSNIGLDYLNDGRIEEAFKFLVHSIQFSERIGNRFMVLVASIELGLCHLIMGNNEEAYLNLTSTFEQCEEMGVLDWASFSLSRRSLCLIELGRGEEAERDARAALAYPLTLADNLDVRADLSEVLVARGNAAEAVSLLEGVMDMYDRSQVSSVPIRPLRNLAHAHAVLGNREEAEMTFLEFDSYKDIVEAWDYAKGLRWWGEAMASWGELGRAREKLGSARERFVGLGATWELRKVDEDLARLDPD
jgi:tetratricopeptide (TPR) repeat protein